MRRCQGLGRGAAVLADQTQSSDLSCPERGARGGVHLRTAIPRLGGRLTGGVVGWREVVSALGPSVGGPCARVPHGGRRLVGRGRGRMSTVAGARVVVLRARSSSCLGGGVVGR